MTKNEIAEAKEVSGKCMKTTGEVLKVLAEIGNGVYTGGMWALCTAVPVVGIPLKICAGISGMFIHSWLTSKTDKMIDGAVDEASKIMDKIITATDNKM